MPMFICLEVQNVAGPRGHEMQTVMMEHSDVKLNKKNTEDVH